MFALLLNNLLLVRKLADHVSLQIRHFAMHIGLKLENHWLHHFHQRFPQICALHPLQHRFAPRLNRRPNLFFPLLRLLHNHLRRRGRNRRRLQRSHRFARRVSLLLRCGQRRRLLRRAAQQPTESQRRDRLRREHRRDGSRQIQRIPQQKRLVCGGCDDAIVENVGGHDGAGGLEDSDDSTIAEWS